jgi:hypothetical protein
VEFFDVGAVVWILRKCVWWVPDFSVQKYRRKLHELDAQMRDGRTVHSSLDQAPDPSPTLTLAQTALRLNR